MILRIAFRLSVSVGYLEQMVCFHDTAEERVSALLGDMVIRNDI